MPIRYRFSGERGEYKQLLRQFRLDTLLDAINRMSARIIKSEPGDIGYGVVWEKYSVVDGHTKMVHTEDVLVSGWALTNLAYNAIIATNDYRGKDAVSDNELFALIAETEAIRENQESEFLDTVPEGGNADFFFYLWGFAGEQFKMEAPGRATINAARDLYILFEVAPRVQETSVPNIADVVRRETGVEWETIVAVLYLAWFGSTISPYLEELTDHILWNEALTKDDFDKVIERYTCSYKEVKSSHLGRQILYTKPFVRTHRSGVICVNCFLGLFLYEHSILWIARECYRKMQSQQFTSDFGYCFETYFRELLSQYLDGDSFERIPESDAKRADWRIELGDVKILVEQKSAVLGLAAKQQNSDTETTKEFLTRHIIEALEQLEATEQYYDDGKYIKFILLYEDYLHPQILDALVQMDECTINNDEHYWIITIGEMEMLLHTYSENPDLFFSAINEMVRRRAEQSLDGRDILHILNQMNVTANSHWSQGKFLEYKNLVKNKARQYLPK